MYNAKKIFLFIVLINLSGLLKAQDMILDTKTNRFLINQKSDKPRLDVIVQSFTDYEKNVISKEAVMDTTTKPTFDKVSETEYNVTASRMGEKLTFVVRDFEKLEKGYNISFSYKESVGPSSKSMSQIAHYSLLGEKCAVTQNIPFGNKKVKIKISDSTQRTIYTLNVTFTYPKPQLMYVDITNGYGNKSWEDTAQIRKIVSRVNQVPTVYSHNNAVPDRIVTNYGNLFFRFKKAYYDSEVNEAALFCKIDNKFWTKTQLEMYPVFDVESLGEKAWWYILPSGEHEVTAGYIPGGNLETYKFVMNKTWDKVAIHYLTYAAHLFMMLFYMYPWILLIITGLILFANRGKRLKKAREATRRTKLELQAIQAQLNPHFMFNAMGSIQGLINKNEIEKANIYLTDFSKLLRNSLNNSDKEMIPLSEELRTLDSYVRLEKLRFNFRYKFFIDEDIETSHVEIPSLLIQPLIENAIKHGISGLGEIGLLDVSFIKNENDLVVEVRDNGKGFDVSQESSGQGIRLTRERIKLLNKSKNKIEMKIESGNGTVARLILKHAF
ncbi:sensor histidine kinase [Dyadobacter psychrotolerans]|nr:histidine kinase [Dyadobacter psychrotolerans]